AAPKIYRLADAVQGGRRKGQRVVWWTEDGGREDITGATLSGTIQRPDGSTVAIAGALTLIAPTTGEFDWAYHANDVSVAGQSFVQFEAAYGSGATPGRTVWLGWLVR
ncbi:MAG: hypothetical protein ACOH2M_09705, partial [Cypionkella sp.]